MNDQTKIVVANSFRHLAVKNLGEGIASGFSSIGYKGKTWSLKQSGEDPKFFADERGMPYPYFDCIILAMHEKTSKMFYTPGTYNEDSAGAPICTSLDGDKPDAGVPEPQSSSCGICKNNVWGSAANGGRGKACQDHRKMAVLIMPYMTKHVLEKPLVEPVYFKVPPASLKPLKIYGDSLVHRGIPHESIITRITFVPGKQFEMKFELKEALTDAEAPVVLRLVDDPQTRSIIGTTGAAIYEEDDAPPAISKTEKPADHGLLQAFGEQQPPTEQSSPNQVVPIKRGPGRPRKPAAPAPAAAPAQEQPVDGGGEGDEPQLPWEADDELEGAVAKALQQKMGGMLPK
jgi:hypothetical protein